MVSSKVLGIDLGTSSSAAAVLIDGKIQIIPSSEKSNGSVKPFPSVVSFNQDGIGCTIGNSAVEESVYNPKGTIFNVKRKMGSKEKIRIFEKEYLPQFISALLLLKIKIDAEKFLNEKISKCVITVPANFNDIQRQATKEAGEIAGLNVVRLISEPVSASVSYGLDKIQSNSKILVFDMGAGTLDVSVIEIENGLFEVLATSGPTDLGGIDMNEKIVTWLKKIVFEKEKNFVLDEFAEHQLNRIAEKLKILLSQKESVSFEEDITSSESQIKISGNITRNDFEEMINPIIKKSEKVIYDILKEAKIPKDKIDRLIPIGGPTKIPIIQKMLSSIKIPEEGVDPDFAVCIGAAIQGAVMAGDSNLPALYQGLTLLNVTPLDIGEEAQKDGQRIIKLMIPKNTTYPTEFSETFWVNKPMQTEVPISIWQGKDFESNPSFADNVNIGHFVLRNLTKGIANEINVTYSIDDNGILTVSANEVSGNSSGQIIVDRIWDESSPPPQLEHDKEVLNTIEMNYRSHTMSPYEIPIEQVQTPSYRNSDSEKYCWMCDSLKKAIDILKKHHNFDISFFDNAKFPLSLQLEKQYVFAYIQMTGGPIYPISIHNSLKEKSNENQRMLVVILVHELLHAIHPDWNHDKIRPEEKKLANLAGYFDALHNMDILFLSGKMSLCNNEMSHSDKLIKIDC